MTMTDQTQAPRPRVAANPMSNEDGPSNAPHIKARAANAGGDGRKEQEGTSGRVARPANPSDPGVPSSGASRTPTPASRVQSVVRPIAPVASNKKTDTSAVAGNAPPMVAGARMKVGRVAGPQGVPMVSGERSRKRGGGGAGGGTVGAGQQAAASRMQGQVEAARAQFGGQQGGAVAAGSIPITAMGSMGGATGQRGAVNPAGQVGWDPRGIYNPMAAQPLIPGSVGTAQIPVGSVGVGQITGQVPVAEVGKPGIIGGIAQGVTPPGVYGPSLQRDINLPYASPFFPAGQVAGASAVEDAWFARMGVSQHAWLHEPASMRAAMLRRVGVSDALIASTMQRLDAAAAAAVGHGPSSGMHLTRPVHTPFGVRPAGQAAGAGVTPSGVFAGISAPWWLLIGAAVVGVAWWITSRKHHGARHNPLGIISAQ
jgi:hypothetical protein